MVTVWSERQTGAWTDCTQSATLMALVYGGFTKFPLGIYSNAEREALQQADDRPDSNIGATFDDTTLAVRRRYGISIPQILDGSPTGLAKALRIAGRGYMIAGSQSRAPSAQRRWDPGFSGNHAIFVGDYRASDDTVLWLDPLATMNFAGDRVPVGAVLHWAFSPNDARVVSLNEYAKGADMALGPKAYATAPARVVLIPGSALYAGPDKTGPEHSPGYRTVAADAFVSTLTIDGGGNPVGIWRGLSRELAKPPLFWAPQSSVQTYVPIQSGATTAQITQAKAQGRAEGIQAARDDLAGLT